MVLDKLPHKIVQHVFALDTGTFNVDVFYYFLNTSYMMIQHSYDVHEHNIVPKWINPFHDFWNRFSTTVNLRRPSLNTHRSQTQWTWNAVCRTRRIAVWSDNISGLSAWIGLFQLYSIICCGLQFASRNAVHVCRCCRGLAEICVLSSFCFVLKSEHSNFHVWIPNVHLLMVWYGGKRVDLLMILIEGAGGLRQGVSMLPDWEYVRNYRGGHLNSRFSVYHILVWESCNELVSYLKSTWVTR